MAESSLHEMTQARQALISESLNWSFDLSLFIYLMPSIFTHFQMIRVDLETFSSVKSN